MTKDKNKLDPSRAYHEIDEGREAIGFYNVHLCRSRYPGNLSANRIDSGYQWGDAAEDK
jgi:hypothetical protein